MTAATETTTGAMDHLCAIGWRTSHDGEHGPVIEGHFCELRPHHRRKHMCPCGARADGSDPWVDWLPTPAAIAAGSVVPHPPICPPRRFVLDRLADVSGVSGVGIVAEGVEFTDGCVAVRWLGENPSTAAWASIEAVEAVHGHEGKTVIRWVDRGLDGGLES